MRTYLKSFTFVPLAFVVALTMMMAGCAEQNPLEAEKATVAPESAEAPSSDQRQSGSITTDVVGDVEGGGDFVGELTVTRFYEEGGELLAEGTITGTLTDAAENVIGTVEDEQVTDIPVDVLQNSTCEILFLELGPLELDLLGLVVELDQVTLQITAEAGEGNLLGNLLCAVANLLNPDGGVLDGIANLLNQILGVLGDITLEPVT